MAGYAGSAKTATINIAPERKLVGIAINTGFYGARSGAYSNINITFNQVPTSYSEIKACSSGFNCTGSNGSFNMTSTGSGEPSVTIIERVAYFTTIPTSVTYTMSGVGTH